MLVAKGQLPHSGAGRPFEVVTACVNTSRAEILLVPPLSSVVAVKSGAPFWLAHWMNAEMEYLLTMQLE